jgi:hypothetical protein
MADSDKDIVIRPRTNESEQPTITFTGKENVTVTCRVFVDGTLSFESSEGQQFSISPTLSDIIFRVADVSGVPLFQINGTDRIVDILPNGGDIKVDGFTPLSGTITFGDGDGLNHDIDIVEGFIIKWDIS